MNKRITKKEAVRKHRAMWNWIADYIEKKKEEQCIPELKSMYLEKQSGMVENNCYCCEYVRSICYECEKSCPVVWKPTLSCCDPGGIYRKCIDALTWEEQAEIARQIANLSEREDDPEIDIL